MRAQPKKECGPKRDEALSAFREKHPEGFCLEKSGSDLLSQGLPSQVPSALEGLTSVFGMGTGVTPPLSPPKSVCQKNPKVPDTFLIIP